jgi:hypothetical protein
MSHIGDKGEAQERASEQGKGWNAGLIPAPVPNSIELILDRIGDRRWNRSSGRLEDTERKGGLDGMSVLATLMRLLIGHIISK